MKRYANVKMELTVEMFSALPDQVLERIDRALRVEFGGSLEIIQVSIAPTKPKA